MSGAVNERRAALLIHGLDQQDGSWLLQALPAPQRDSLQKLLTELQELGIPAQPLAADLPRLPLAAPADDSVAARLARLAGQEVAWLAGQLETEPVALVATLLRIRPWAWQDCLLASFEPLRRRSVQMAMREIASVPAQLAETILQALQKNMAGHTPPRRFQCVGWLRKLKGFW